MVEAEWPSPVLENRCNGINNNDNASQVIPRSNEFSDFAISWCFEPLDIVNREVGSNGSTKDVRWADIVDDDGQYLYSLDSIASQTQRR